jgi:hypothetical protein
VREAIIRGAGSLKEIVEPEVIEEFLEHLRANPALAKMIDRDLYEGVYREITGNKTTSVLTTSIELDAKSLDRLDAITKRMETAAAAVAKGADIEVDEVDADGVDEIAKSLEESVAKALEEFAPQVDEIAEPERKGALTAIMDGIRGLFKAAPREAKNMPPAEPAKADPSVQEDLRKQFEEIAAKHQIAA